MGRTAATLTLDVGAGRITLPLSTIEQVTTGVSDVGQFQAGAQRLAPDDVPGWLALARWAAERDLRTQANQAYERVLAIDPGNVTAHQGLGHVLEGTAWMTPDDANRARGLVRYGSQWLTPEEHAALLQEQAQRDADARAREEARARQQDAEDRAAAAAQAAQDSYGDGVPLWMGGYGYGYGYRHAYPYRTTRANAFHPSRPAVAPPPVVRPPVPPARPAVPAHPVASTHAALGVRPQQR